MGRTGEREGEKDDFGNVLDINAAKDDDSEGREFSHNRHDLLQSTLN